MGQRGRYSRRIQLEVSESTTSSPRDQTKKSPLPAKTEVRIRETGFLPAANRFDEYPEGHIYRSAQDALNRGDVLEAIKIFGGRNSIERPDGPVEKRMMAAVQKASDEQIGFDPAQELMDRVDGAWLSRLRGLQAPVSPTDVATTRGELENHALSLQDAAGVELTGDQKRRRNAFVAALQEKQATLFPQMRQQTQGALGRSLFAQDVELHVVGPNSATLRLTSYRFISNAPIQALMSGLQEPLRRLRFRSMEFGTEFGVRYRYPLQVPADRAVGYWSVSDNSFVEVK